MKQIIIAPSAVHASVSYLGVINGGRSDLHQSVCVIDSHLVLGYFWRVEFEREIHLLVQKQLEFGDGLVTRLGDESAATSNAYVKTPCFSPDASPTELSLFRPSLAETLTNRNKSDAEDGCFREVHLFNFFTAERTNALFLVLHPSLQRYQTHQTC